MEISSNSDVNCDLNTEKIIRNIIEGNSKIYVPICNHLAYIEGDVINNTQCYVHIGDDFFIKTNFLKAKNIVSAKKHDLIKGNLTKLIDNTFEIVEQHVEESETKKKNMTERENNEMLNELKTKKITKEIINYQSLEKKANIINKCKNHSNLQVKSGKEILRDMIQQYKKGVLKINK